jgi:hypothetical protein
MRLQRLAKLVGPILITLALAGGAWAYLSAGGSRSATAGTNIAVSAVSVTAATATQSMLPTGSPTGDVNVTLHNGNSSPVHISALSLDASQGTGGFGSSGSSCALSFANQSNGGSGWTIAANGSVSADLVNSMTMGTTAASSCQGQSLTVYLKAS